jgi:hypothetical protein
MTPETRFKVNTPTVTHETIAGESVIINLETGNYYSLQGTGANIWALVVQNGAVSEIVDELLRFYNGIPGEIEGSVTQLLAELHSERLIIPDQATGRCNNKGGLPITTSPDKLEFQMPQLQKFTDMQELLLLDPIHEVDAGGWPSAKQNQ